MNYYNRSFRRYALPAIAMATLLFTSGTAPYVLSSPYELAITVTDTENNPIPGATVEVFGPKGGKARSRWDKRRKIYFAHTTAYHGSIVVIRCPGYLEQQFRIDWKQEIPLHIRLGRPGDENYYAYVPVAYRPNRKVISVILPAMPAEQLHQAADRLGLVIIPDFMKPRENPYGIPPIRSRRERIAQDVPRIYYLRKQDSSDFPRTDCMEIRELRKLHPGIFVGILASSPGNQPIAYDNSFSCIPSTEGYRSHREILELLHYHGIDSAGIQFAPDGMHPNAWHLTADPGIGEGVNDIIASLTSMGVITSVQSNVRYLEEDMWKMD